MKKEVRDIITWNVKDLFKKPIKEVLNIETENPKISKIELIKPWEKETPTPIKEEMRMRILHPISNTDIKFQVIDKITQKTITVEAKDLMGFSSKKSVNFKNFKFKYDEELTLEGLKLNYNGKVRILSDKNAIRIVEDKFKKLDEFFQQPGLETLRSDGRQRISETYYKAIDCVQSLIKNPFLDMDCSHLILDINRELDAISIGAPCFLK